MPGGVCLRASLQLGLSRGAVPRKQGKLLGFGRAHEDGELDLDRETRHDTLVTVLNVASPLSDVLDTRAEACMHGRLGWSGEVGDGGERGEVLERKLDLAMSAQFALKG